MELEHEGECIVLAVPDAVLGRTSASEIHVSHPLVSRRHCRFEATLSGVFVEDLGSSNGTYLNGRRLSVRTRVRRGDVVQIGKDGPRFALLAASIGGRDVSGLPDEDEATILAGDPRAAGLPTRVEVAPSATPVDEFQTRESPATPQRRPPTTSSSIPVATPIGSGSDGDSFVAQTELFSGGMPEPPTRVVGDDEPPVVPFDPDEPDAPADEEPEMDEATRMVAPPFVAVPPAAPPAPPAPLPPEDPPTVFRPREGAAPPAPTPAPPPAAALPPAPAQPLPPAPPRGMPDGRPHTNAAAPPPAVAVAPPPSGAVAQASAPESRGRGGGLWIGLVLGLLLAIAAGVLTPLGPLLHNLAPWAKTEPPGDGE